jgi:hypothetical protein
MVIDQNSVNIFTEIKKCIVDLMRPKITENGVKQFDRKKIEQTEWHCTKQEFDFDDKQRKSPK